MTEFPETVNLGELAEQIADEYVRDPDSFKAVFKEVSEPLAAQAEPLHPDLVGWVEEDGPFGHPMLRHPLVYNMFLSMPGETNHIYAQRKAQLAEAIEACDWHLVVFTHERPYRLRALIDYVTGRYDQDDEGPVIPLDSLGAAQLTQDTLDLVADVWVDSENIGQHIEDWRVLFGNAEHFFLGTYTEQQAFAALPDPIRAYRAGIDDGDWSWTTDRSIAEFFARRFQDPALPVMEADIPKADCFGYLTRRGESELLVRLDPAREVRVSGNQP